jgi:hypothetical protein
VNLKTFFSLHPTARATDRIQYALASFRTTRAELQQGIRESAEDINDREASIVLLEGEVAALQETANIAARAVEQLDKLLGDA